MRVRITPARAYAHGHVENVLIRIGVNPPSPRSPDGIVVMDLTEAQITSFQLIGNAHHVERLPDGPIEAPAAAPAPAPVPVPTVKCPLCQSGVAIAPGSPDVFGTDCGNCGAHLLIGTDASKGGERFIMASEPGTKTSPLPVSLGPPQTVQELMAQGYSKKDAKRIVHGPGSAESEGE